MAVIVVVGFVFDGAVVVDDDAEYDLYEEQCAVWDDEQARILLYVQDLEDWQPFTS